jgi:YidC/Oxa1 family membrane protein insertase
MDKKNFLIGILCIVAGFTFYFWQVTQMEEQRREQLREQERQRALQPQEPPAAAPATEQASTPMLTPGQAPANGEDLIDLLAREVDIPIVEASAIAAEVAQAEDTAATAETLLVLENDFIRVTFTTHGGAIRTVEFLQTKRGGKDYFIFNKNGYLPALSLSVANPTGGLREFGLSYEITRQTNNMVEFTLEARGLRITRSYRLQQANSDEDPYVLIHQTAFENTSDSAREFASVYFNLGTSLPTISDKRAQFLNVGYFEGNKSQFIGANRFTSSSGFLGIGARSAAAEVIERGRFEWASVKNQFFTSVLTGESPGHEIHVHPVFVDDLPSELAGRPGVTGTVGYRLGVLSPGIRQALDFKYYVGPKEYLRLQRLGNDQDRVMQFGFLAFFSKLLLLLMYAIHSVVPSWGWSIVLMTVLLKLLFWPLTAKAAKSQKRMAKIQAPMKELREKYKDNPQKMQQETIKLFREAKVNPAAGCLPILIQMPIFIGLFYMLRTASELRYEPFLWVTDLASPDTLFTIAGFPINILPVLMGLSMFFQMRMVPVSPTADPMQQKIFKLLPFVMVVFLYNFSSGLTLYWTVQNLLTILQQWLTNRKKDPEMEAELSEVETKVKAVTAKPSPTRKGRRRK